MSYDDLKSHQIVAIYLPGYLEMKNLNQVIEIQYNDKDAKSGGLVLPK